MDERAFSGNGVESQTSKLQAYVERFDAILEFVGRHFRAVKYLNALESLKKVDPQGGGWSPSVDMQRMLDAYNELSGDQKNSLDDLLPIVEEYRSFYGGETRYPSESVAEGEIRLKRDFIISFLKQGRSF